VERGAKIGRPTEDGATAADGVPPADDTKAGRRARPSPDKAHSRHYRRARRDRGAETRAQLVEAALDVFGRLGFEGATTREIARAADANLAAIVYHFGSKEALHLAVAEHVATGILEKVGPTLAEVSGAQATLTPEAARASFRALIATFVDVILGSAEAERWSRFIVREQLQPTAAFDVIHGFFGGAIATATRLVAAALGEPESDAIRLRVFTFFGQVMVFRVAQTLVLRTLSWAAIGPDERETIKARVIGQIETILEAGAKP
jgi:AcrR family transcriptional regulator